MHLQQLSLTNFKNYEAITLHFSPRLNLFIGANGAGKTNLLDAIYYLCFCKSYFHNSDQYNIRHAQDFCRLVGDFLLKDKQERIIAKVGKRRKKEFSRNTIPYKKLSEHIGLLPIVIIAPDDRNLITDASEVRRKWLDSLLAQLNATYLQKLIQYNKVLLQRKALLKQFNDNQYFDETLLSAYDQQLLPLGNFIHQKRKEIISAFLPILQSFYEQISGGKEQVDCQYQSHLLTNEFSTLLKNSQVQDRYLQRTTKGIHRDDVIFTIQQFSLKKFGSQGQQKSFLVALKLAVYQLIAEQKKVQPILLLDDILDKLDKHRIHHLLAIINTKKFGQVFISDTQLDSITQLFAPTILPHHIYQIDSGTITQLST